MRPLARNVRQHMVERARRARLLVLLILPLLAGVIIAYNRREQLFGVDLPVRVAAVIAMVILGWAFAREAGRAMGPFLFRRLEPGTAGTLGFLIRLFALLLTVLMALRIAGLQPRTIAVGGAITAVVFGLAAQQTLGNVIAGTVLLSARPFRVGDRVRLHAGGLGGETEGEVRSLGLLYTTLANGDDRIMVPNSIVLASAVVPLREPSAVDLRVRVTPEAKPTAIERRLSDEVEVPTRRPPEVELEELDGEELVVRVSATPSEPSDGARLADEVLSALAPVTADA